MEDLDRAPKLMWPYLLEAICWGIWKGRIKRVFDCKSLMLDELIISVFSLLVEWVSISKEFEEGFGVFLGQYCLCFISLVFIPLLLVEEFIFGDIKLFFTSLFPFLSASISVQSSSSLESEGTFPYVSFTNQEICK